MLINLILLVLFSYVFASIPFGWYVSKFYKINIFEIGSGNIGATNIYRALGLKPAIFVFLLDALKGIIPVLLAKMLFPMHPIIHVLIGALVIFGHAYPFLIGFKGGKGAATGLGVLLILSPPIFLITAIIAAIIIAISHYISVGTISAALILPFLFYWFHYPRFYLLFVSLVCIFVIYRHKKNIQRLLQGKENKIY